MRTVHYEHFDEVICNVVEIEAMSEDRFFKGAASRAREEKRSGKMIFVCVEIFDV